MTIERALVGTADGGAALYVEDVFSTYLYTGNGSTQTITNGIDLAGKGGMVWVKPRSVASDHRIVDTIRSAPNTLTPNSTAASYVGSSNTVTGFSSNGFISSDGLSGYPWASWTFLKAPKFFDVVTYTGNGTSSRSIPHNLGSVPGFIVIKCTSGTGNWVVYHRSFNENLYLNSTGGSGTIGGLFYISGNSTASNIVLGTNYGECNSNGDTYVAYLFAHDAGGFGASGTDSVVSCGSFTTDASGNASVNLGWEPQYIITKPASTGGNWLIYDAMRGVTSDYNNTTSALKANTSDAESSLANNLAINATGFKVLSTGGYYPSSSTMIYIAIRRPMKTPTSGASVFAPIATSGDVFRTTSFAVDATFGGQRASNYPSTAQRLTGANYLTTYSTGAENVGGGGNPVYWDFSYNDGIKTNYFYGSAANITWNFKRAPGFFDVVCYTGNGLTQNISHNLGVKPELMFIKGRNEPYRNWIAARQGNGGYLNTTDALTAGITFLDLTTKSTANTFEVNANPEIGGSYNYVAYLFASCLGVSKVGSYTGNGSSQTINCGFTAGARFILIKRTDSTGDWYVWDTARGIVSANDPHLSLNTSAAEVTTDDSIDPDATGFIVNQVSATNINVSSASYIFLAIS